MGLGATLAYASDFYWEKYNRKKAELSRFESPGINMFTQAKTTDIDKKCTLHILATFGMLGF